MVAGKRIGSAARPLFCFFIRIFFTDGIRRSAPAHHVHRYRHFRAILNHPSAVLTDRRRGLFPPGALISSRTGERIGGLSPIPLVPVLSFQQGAARNAGLAQWIGRRSRLVASHRRVRDCLHTYNGSSAVCRRR